MDEHLAIMDILAVINNKRVIPTVVMWNRLEGRPRALNFDRALKAEVRDALFMVTKQWQMGEFRGDDAGSPVTAKIHMETTRLNKYSANGNPVHRFEYNVPLETKVEQRKLPIKAGDQPFSLNIALLMGRQWLKMTDKPELSRFREQFFKAYPVNRPSPNTRQDSHICAHQAAWAQYAAVARRAMDGAALYIYLADDSDNHSYDLFDGTVAVTPTQKVLLKKIEGRFVEWFKKLFYQPADEHTDAWLPSKLEYQFACSAPKKGSEKLFTAQEYYHGHLDWYHLDVDRTEDTLGDVDTNDEDPADLEESHTNSFLPVPIQFDGMPNTRWWTFEDGKTNFGDIKPDTTDLSKLLLMEFGLVYANDWCLVPFTLPAGTVSNVRGMSVTNVFGERIWVQAAGSGSDDDWKRWNMFTLNAAGVSNEPADLSLLLLPTVPKIQEGQPIEEIVLTRDEIANMAWGIETRILLPNGASKSGRESALELSRYFEQIVSKENESNGGGLGTERDYMANIRYQLMNSVPENWIPFISVHVEGDNRETQLKRAALPRIIEADSEGPKRIRPRTSLLRVGLNRDPREAFNLFEEEVPRMGVSVHQSYQRTRWYGGRVFNWLGIRKQVGHGEKSSGLAYDLIVPTQETS